MSLTRRLVCPTKPCAAVKTCSLRVDTRCRNGEHNGRLLGFTCSELTTRSIRVRDRSQLLGSTPPPGSGRSSPFGGSNHSGYSQRFAEDLESQNDAAIETLSSKVKLLKDVSECSKDWEGKKERDTNRLTIFFLPFLFFFSRLRLG